MERERVGLCGLPLAESTSLSLRLATVLTEASGDERTAEEEEELNPSAFRSTEATQ